MLEMRCASQQAHRHRERRTVCRQRRQHLTFGGKLRQQHCARRMLLRCTVLQLHERVVCTNARGHAAILQARA
jgi:hypothetical protein